MDEQRAIQRLKQGQVSGLEFLVNRYQVRAVRVAYLITRDPEAGLRMLYQDCFLQVYRSIRSFDETRSFEPWFLERGQCVRKDVTKSARRVPCGEDRSLLQNWLRVSSRLKDRWSQLSFKCTTI
jgi:RNA polymerase sigma-70 factor (ECF subfamily)